MPTLHDVPKGIENAFYDNVEVKKDVSTTVRLDTLIKQANAILEEEGNHVSGIDIVIRDKNDTKYVLPLPSVPVRDNTIVPKDAFTFSMESRNHHIEEDIYFAIDALVSNDNLPEGYDEITVDELIPEVARRVETKYDYSVYTEFIVDTLHEVAKENNEEGK